MTSLGGVKAQRCWMGQLERQLLTRRTIAGNLFCGTCGYNLRTRPTVGVCPECGKDYDARPVSMHNILLDDDVAFPFPAVGGMLACGLLGAGFLHAAYNHGTDWAYVPGAMFAFLSILYAWHTWRNTARYIHHRRLLHDVDDDE